VANSIYGFTGANLKGVLPMLPVAMTVTFYGRWMIESSKAFVEREYVPAEVLYGKQTVHDLAGDSVSGDTPILCRRDGAIRYCNIEELFNEDDAHTLLDKESHALSDVEVWSDGGWTRIRRVIRHRTDKQCYRVTVHTGSVVVTEDHSLLRPDGESVRPNALSVGESLLIAALPMLTGVVQVDAELAWVWGFFLGDGNCGWYEGRGGAFAKHSWRLANQNMTYLDRAQRALQRAYPNHRFPIYDTMESSSVFHLTACGDVKALVNEWRPRFYDSRKQKRVPDEVWTWNQAGRRAFFDGYWAADGTKTNNQMTLSNKGQIGTAGLFFLAESLGYRVSCNTRADKPHIYKLTLSSKLRKAAANIKKIEPLGTCNDYVYDLETDNHHFAAGVGQLVVHNTDSVMIRWNRGTDHETFLQLFDLSKEAAKRITDYFRLHTIDDAVVLAFEKIYYPYYLYRKKGYAAIKYERPDKPTKDVKGIAQVRRDSCEWVCASSDAVLDELLDMRDPDSVKDRASTVVKRKLDDLMRDEVPWSELTLTKQLAKKPYKGKTPPVHAQVARKVAARDPARAYKGGDRVEFVVVDIGDPLGKRKVADKGEDPQYAAAQRLKLDKVWYIENQFRNPISSLLEIKGLYDDASALFQEPVRQVRNKQQNMKDLTHWFKPKSQ